MEKKESSSGAPPRPTITLPPRLPMEAFFTGGLGASPGPMTLVSNFFGEGYADSPNCRSFSQLLAGAMGSPMALGFVGPSSTENSSSKEGTRSVEASGFKQNRPVNLVVARSPLFTIPPGLSPSGLLNSPGFFSPQSPFGMSHQQALAQVTAQAALAHSQMHKQTASAPASRESLTHQPYFTPNEALQSIPSTSDPKSSLLEVEGSHSDGKYQPSSNTPDKLADDGYNWRKYGQKQVKGSEYPRSYYKCTHPDCPVKKKVECTPAGQVTEIIYKGQHNHEPPKPSRRAKDGSTGNQNGSMIPQQKLDPGSESHAGNLNDATPAQSVPEKNGECAQAAPIQLPGSSDSEELGDTEIAEDGDGEEPCPKRRTITAGPSSVSLSHKTVTEPKIIVQTRSEVDLLDDGYRWRKYGQKVVKGNPYPRSYYKCTSAGCNVRKHVERASTDPKAVITTYEGKHNHEVPAARNSSHNAANANAPHAKPTKVVAQKLPSVEEMDFGTSDQRPVLLRLKEEEIAV